MSFRYVTSQAAARSCLHAAHVRVLLDKLRVIAEIGVGPRNDLCVSNVRQANALGAQLLLHYPAAAERASTFTTDVPIGNNDLALGM